MLERSRRGGHPHFGSCVLPRAVRRAISRRGGADTVPALRVQLHKPCLPATPHSSSHGGSSPTTVAFARGGSRTAVTSTGTGAATRASAPTSANTAACVSTRPARSRRTCSDSTSSGDARWWWFRMSRTMFATPL
ncbi:hypothetical protein MRX96_027542 [Rhipicephalus microplus]